MSKPLFDALKGDHKNIRRQMAELKRELGLPSPIEEHCFEVFRRLKATVISHAKAEELVLYSIVEEPRQTSEAALRHFAFEGYEEHDLIEFLMKEMATAEELSFKWNAQVIVLCEILEKHLTDEEIDFFPKIEEVLNEVATDDLSAAYEKERDIIFAKKTGKRPAISLAPMVRI